MKSKYILREEEALKTYLHSLVLESENTGHVQCSSQLPFSQPAPNLGSSDICINGVSVCVSNIYSFIDDIHYLDTIDIPQLNFTFSIDDIHVDYIFYKDQRFSIIDTRRLIFYNKILPDHLNSTYKKIVLLNRGAIGFACDSVTKDVSLDVRNIRWRTEQTTKWWLAGTVMKKCFLWDLEKFIAKCPEQ